MKAVPPAALPAAIPLPELWLTTLHESWHYILLIIGFHALVTFTGRRTLTGKGRKGSHVGDVLAYNFTVLLTDLTLGYIGVRAHLNGSADAISGTRHERLYAPSDEFVLMCNITAAFEFYNFFIAMIVPEYKEPAFLGHHVVTYSLAIYASAPYLAYYGFFFFGVSMCSSAPLCLVDISNTLRGVKGKNGKPRFPSMEMVHNVARAVFAVMFLIIRCGIWPVVSYNFWRDSVEALEAGAVHSSFTVIFFLCANIFLTGLQLLWGKKVIAGLMRIYAGGWKTDVKRTD